MSSILLIGSGRLAKHLWHWNSLLKTPNNLFSWNRKENTLSELSSLISKVDLVWLAIADSAIITFYNENLAGSKKTCVHFSGALQDPRLISVHPLMSFPHELMPDALYSKIYFITSEPQIFSKALPGFSNNFSVISEDKRTLYHALCVISGNFPQYLWQEILLEFKKLNIPEAAIENYIHQITENFIQLKEKALTGPIQRKDLSTIEKNLVSLEKTNLKTIYKTFVEVFLK